MNDIIKAGGLILSIVVFILLIKFLGVKGILGMIIGFTLMGYLVISGNPIFYYIAGNKNKEKTKMMTREFLK